MTYDCKVEKILKGSLGSIPSPTSSVKIQIMLCLITSIRPQRNIPAHNLNFHWRWRWWDQIQATFQNLFYFTVLTWENWCSRRAIPIINGNGGTITLWWNWFFDLCHSRWRIAFCADDRRSWRPVPIFDFYGRPNWILRFGGRWVRRVSVCNITFGSEEKGFWWHSHHEYGHKYNL